MKQYKAAIVGYGGMGRWHVEGIHKTDRIAFKGTYDINPDRMKAAEADGLTVSYPSYEALLADEEIDIVVIATPNNFHMSLAVQAMEAGKAVLCEKPVAMSSEEAQAMIDCSKRTGSVFTVHQNRRHDPDYLHVCDSIEQGLLGDAFEIESRVTGARGIPEGWRLYAVAGGGMMLDWGVHLIDQMTELFKGHKVTSVYCDMYHVVYKECDDGFKLTLKFDNGVSCMVEVGTSHYIDAPRWYVCGNRGTLSIPDWSCNGKIVRAKDYEIVWGEDIVYTKAGPTRTMAPRAKDTTEEITLDPDRFEGDYDITYRNLAAVLDGTEELLVKPEETLRVMKIMEAAFESDRTGQAILCEL